MQRMMAPSAIDRLTRPVLATCGLAAAAAIVAGWRIGSPAFGYRDVLAASVLLAAVVMVLLGPAGIRLGLVAWICMFVLGTRTLHLTPRLPLHPLVVVMLALAALLIVQEKVFRRRPLSWRAPRPLLAFSLFWAWGWFLLQVNSLRWDTGMNDLLNFAMLFPVLAVTGWVLADSRAWPLIMGSFFAAGAAIGLLGMLEYLVPGIKRLFPGLMTEELVMHPGGGFTRANFAFWGGPIATFVSALAAPLILPLWVRLRALSARLALVAGLVLQLTGIYLGGYRSMWAGCAMAATLLVYLRAGARAALAWLAALAGLFWLLPQAGQERFNSLLSALQGNFVDGSSFGRWQRALGALNSMLVRPWGIGWGGSGWVHSDFLQVGANLGVMAGALLLAWYASTLLRLALAAWRRRGDALTLGLLGSFFVVGVLLAAEGIEVYSHLALPAWLVWAMAEVRLKEVNGAV